MKIVIKQDSKKEYYANLIARNGKVVWKTPDGYKTRAGVMKAVDLINSSYSWGYSVIDETKKSF